MEHQKPTEIQKIMKSKTIKPITSAVFQSPRGLFIDAACIDPDGQVMATVFGTYKKVGNVWQSITNSEVRIVFLGTQQECETFLKSHHETPEVENTWNEFWKPIVSNPDGSINLEQLKKELYDFRQVMNNVPEVYDHITGGTVSKILTKPSVVKDFADEHYAKMMDQILSDAVMPTLQEINDFQPTGSAVSVRRRLRKIIKPVLQRFSERKTQP